MVSPSRRNHPTSYTIAAAPEKANTEPTNHCFNNQGGDAEEAERVCLDLWCRLFRRISSIGPSRRSIRKATTPTTASANPTMRQVFHSPKNGSMKKPANQVPD